jgi:hypothetical protein
VGRFWVNDSNENNDGIPVMAMVDVSLCAMVSASCTVVVGFGESVSALIDNAKGNFISMTHETVICIWNLILADKTHV